MKGVSNDKRQYMEYVARRLKIGVPIRLENSERGYKLDDYTPVKFYRNFVLLMNRRNYERFSYWELWSKMSRAIL